MSDARRSLKHSESKREGEKEPVSGGGTFRSNPLYTILEASARRHLSHCGVRQLLKIATRVLQLEGVAMFLLSDRPSRSPCLTTYLASEVPKGLPALSFVQNGVVDSGYKKLGKKWKGCLAWLLVNEKRPFTWAQLHDSATKLCAGNAKKANRMIVYVGKVEKKPALFLVMPKK